VKAQFHAFFCEILSQGGYLVTEAVNRDAGLAVVDVVGLADGRMDLRYLVVVCLRATYGFIPAMSAALTPRHLHTPWGDTTECPRSRWHVSLGSTLAQLEKGAIIGALDKVGGNGHMAACLLGIRGKTLSRRLTVYRPP